jgi:hypothetical protein
MRRKLFVLTLGSVFSYLNWLSPSYAQTVYEADFDTTFPTFGYSYDYSGYGELDFSATDTSDQTQSAYDVTTPPAATASFDTSQWMLPGYETYTYAGWGLGVGFFLPEGMRPTSGDLSQYTVKFDAKVTGYDENAGPNGLEAPIQIIFQGPTGQSEEYRIGVNGDNLGNFTEVPRLTSTVQSFSLPLSDFASLNDPLPDNFWDFPTMFADTTQLILQIQPSTNAGEIGLDDDNVVSLDNVRFEGPFAMGQPIAGDYDGNGVVEINDYLIWRQEFGLSGTGLSSDGNGNSTVDAADYVVWRDNFVAMASSLAAPPVPEPSTLVGAGLLLSSLGVRRRRPMN